MSITVNKFPNKLTNFTKQQREKIAMEEEKKRNAMELLQWKMMAGVRIPKPTNRIHTQECCISFDSPRSEGGLFVDMSTFLAFGRDYVSWNFEKTGNPVYLNIKQTKKLVPEDMPTKKPTVLGIDAEGGFENNEPEYEETYTVIILPDYATLPFPSLQLPEKVRLAADAIISAKGAERKEQVVSGTADKKYASAYAENLQQIDKAFIVPPSGWKCGKCDETENLWLNLTDGMILCGRRKWDGTGGNNHAVEHYRETGYPLAIKLGTITSDPEAADVYSYPEDDTVLDPHLAEHLAFFGIYSSSLQKTEMTSAERELDQNTNFDWNVIQESGHEVKPLFGPGYTGLVNLENSCYLAATMQVVFSTHSFYMRYYRTQSLKGAFELAPADPTADLNMQLTKLAYGLLSGKYSVPSSQGDDKANAPTASAKQEGIPPRMFKAVIAASHPEFSTMRQQDALEFFLHFLDQVEQANVGNSDLDPSRSFKFGVEDRISCPSGKVSYNRRSDYVLSLNIPLHEAINKEELEAFQQLQAGRSSEGKAVSNDEIVRPRVPLEACLANFSSPEEVEVYSTALRAKTTAVKTTGLTTFPDYLVFHMRKIVTEEGWVPKKLDVYINVPDIIDISHMRSKGLQPGEELLPEGDNVLTIIEPESEFNRPSANEDIVSHLVLMGFDRLHCIKAAISTSNTGVDEAMNWLFSHVYDPDIDAPISQNVQSTEAELSNVDQSKVDTLVSFGVLENIARKALKKFDGYMERAADWIFSNPDASVDAVLPDGIGKYRLIGFISHMGTSTQYGHYVAHILKDGRWVIFNDNKVGASINPPKDTGYLYFFERTNG